MSTINMNSHGQTEISSVDAKNKFGISTLHHKMENGEFRFRLKKSDGTAYIRTESDNVGAWQESHFHKHVQETYIVQRGWIAYAEVVGGKINLSVYCEGELFTTQPNIIHNVYMASHSVIHTVKHGRSEVYDRSIEGVQHLNDYCNKIIDEKEILLSATRGGSNATKNETYTKEYMHFDNLIWQVPAWMTVIFALSIQVLGSSGFEELSGITEISKKNLVAIFLLIISLILFCFSHVMYRFRIHQQSLKKYSRTPVLKSASTYTQLMINTQAFSLISLALIVVQVPASYAVSGGGIGLLLVTLCREYFLRSSSVKN